MASYRRDVAPINKTFDTVNGGLATEDSLGMVDKELRQQRMRESEPGGAAESIDTTFPEVEEAAAAADASRAERLGAAAQEEQEEQEEQEVTEEPTPSDIEEDTAEDTEGGDIPEDASSESEEEVPEDIEEDTSEDTEEDEDEDEGLPEGTLNTVDSAKEYVDEAKGKERSARAKAVLAAEKDGKDRSTLVTWLEAELEADDAIEEE